jgi:hypothetical protein
MPDTHIKIPDVTPIVRYLANGVQTVFAFPFPIFASEDLRVYLNGAQQISGFDIAGADETLGGTVTFDDAPNDDVVVTLERYLPLERMSDYLEGGDFSAASINTELDYMVAALQQVQRENDVMLKYADHEAPGSSDLPSKKLRKNKALGFDGDGNPVALPLSGVIAAPDYSASGVGAVTRTMNDKMSDMVSVKDFGAIGDGITNDAIAIQNALAAHNSVFLPEGTYLISGTIALGAYQSIFGVGAASVIECQADTFDAIQIHGRQNTLSNFKIKGGDVAVFMAGIDDECTQNSLADLQITQCGTGIKLDGYDDTNKPCYWNNFARILIEQPRVNGVHLMRSGTGDTPNANRFTSVRVYSKSETTSGAGFYIEQGAFNNALVDCEANVNGASAQACVRIGAGSNKTLIINMLCESNNSVPNIHLDAGSLDTGIMNLSAESNGSAIYDLSGGEFEAINAGYPEKYNLGRGVAKDWKATLQRYDTEFIDTAGTHVIDLSHSVHIVNATNGAITIQLPAAGDAIGVEMTVKKVDSTANIITITETSGAGPDGKPLLLGGPNDYATMISNGAQWFITSSNRMSGNTRYADTSGTYDIDMAVDTYLISSYAATVTARLPPANAIEAIGRTITIKKTDSSGHAVNVSEQGGAGPDQYTQPLNSRYDAITVTSNGGQWYIVSKFP